MDIVELLRKQAQEIAREGHNGWGNTMIAVAEEIEKLRNAQQDVQLTALRRWLAVSWVIIIVLLVVVIFTIGGN